MRWKEVQRFKEVYMHNAVEDKKVMKYKDSC